MNIKIPGVNDNLISLNKWKIYPKVEGFSENIQGNNEKATKGVDDALTKLLFLIKL